MTGRYSGYVPPEIAIWGAFAVKALPKRLAACLHPIAALHLGVLRVLGVSPASENRKKTEKRRPETFEMGSGRIKIPISK